MVYSSPAHAWIDVQKKEEDKSIYNESGDRAEEGQCSKVEGGRVQ
jgi:hypothetical protein